MERHRRRAFRVPSITRPRRTVVGMEAIVCDARERGVSIRRRLVELGVDVEVATLAAGDYAIGQTVLVERKTVSDLHLTIITGRFWLQIGRLRRGALAPYLLVEGVDLDAGPL